MAGPGDLGNLLKQAQKMQREMDLAREEISGMTLEGSAGGSAARVEVDGNGTVKAVHLTAEARGGDDMGALEDLILAAVQDAQTRAEQVKRERLSEVTGGMDLPGLF
jgi:DNA-binding YbaB/EbfC family protein